MSTSHPKDDFEDVKPSNSVIRRTLLCAASSPETSTVVKLLDLTND